VSPARAASRWRGSWRVWRGGAGDGLGAAIGRASGPHSWLATGPKVRHKRGRRDSQEVPACMGFRVWGPDFNPLQQHHRPSAASFQTPPGALRAIPTRRRFRPMRRLIDECRKGLHGLRGMFSGLVPDERLGRCFQPAVPLSPIALIFVVAPAAWHPASPQQEAGDHRGPVTRAYFSPYSA